MEKFTLSDAEKEFFADISGTGMSYSRLNKEAAADLEKEAASATENLEGFEGESVKVPLMSLISHPGFERGFKQGLTENLHDWYGAALARTIGLSV